VAVLELLTIKIQQMTIESTNDNTPTTPAITYSECYAQVFLGDCLELYKNIEPKSIDLILTDLPYGTTACKWDSIIPFEPLWKQYERIIKDNGAIVLFGSQPFTTKLISSNYEMFKYCWVWDKGKVGGFTSAKLKPLKLFEDIIVFSKKAAAQTKSGDCMNYFPIMVDRKPVTVKNYGKSKIVDAEWQVDGFTKTYDKAYPKSIQKFNNREKDYHPTQKPVPLLEYLIKTYTKEGNTVLDNTMGSGSTGVACKKTGRHFIGIEKDEKYFEIAVRRVSEYCG
jgi:site-specific DNA-methyltransferase (adenine-specific)